MSNSNQKTVLDYVHVVNDLRTRRQICEQKCTKSTEGNRKKKCTKSTEENRQKSVPKVQREMEMCINVQS